MLCSALLAQPRIQSLNILPSNAGQPFRPMSVLRHGSFSVPLADWWAFLLLFGGGDFLDSRAAHEAFAGFRKQRLRHKAGMNFQPLDDQFIERHVHIDGFLHGTIIGGNAGVGKANKGLGI